MVGCWTKRGQWGRELGTKKCIELQQGYCRWRQEGTQAWVSVREVEGRSGSSWWCWWTAWRVDTQVRAGQDCCCRGAESWVAGSRATGWTGMQVTTQSNIRSRRKKHENSSGTLEGDLDWAMYHWELVFTICFLFPFWHGPLLKQLTTEARKWTKGWIYVWAVTIKNSMLALQHERE